jgi:hypothetical protein
MSFDRSSKLHWKNCRVEEQNSSRKKRSNNRRINHNHKDVSGKAGHGDRTIMSDNALRDILRADFRANPQYEVVLFDRLPLDQQDALRDLTRDPDFYGVLMPRDGAGGNMKSVCRDTALLFLTLTQPGTLPGYVLAMFGDECNQAIAKLVMDGVLEIKGVDGFVSGSAAFDLICGRASVGEPKGFLGRLAQAALRYAQALDIDESGKLSARLYFYNRLPVSLRWRRRFPGQEAVASFLGIEPGGVNRRLLDGRWRKLKLAPPSDGWFQWESRERSPHEDTASERYKLASERYKLYVSPHPEHLQEAFHVVVEVLADSSAHHFKVGNDAAGVLRPDKIVIYVDSSEALHKVANHLKRRLAGCPAQGVPFSAAFAEDDGLLSWGIDPVPDEGTLGWQERESWRLWVTNRLARVLLEAKRAGTGPLEPWRFALERVRLENIDPETWTPLTSSLEQHVPGGSSCQ